MTQDHHSEDSGEEISLEHHEHDKHVRKVKHVYGSAENIAKLGSPIERAADPESPNVCYYFYPTWRSQLIHIITYFILCYAAIFGSSHVPATIIRGKLFAIGDTIYFLDLPLLSLIPGFMLGKILLYIYNSKYIIDDKGVEAQVGLVSLNLRQPRLRYEDIRGVEPTQTIWERILGIGTVLVGSAMTDDVEITMSGIAAPRAIQILINSERDQSLKRLTEGGRMDKVQALAITGD